MSVASSSSSSSSSPSSSSSLQQRLLQEDMKVYRQLSTINPTPHSAFLHIHYDVTHDNNDDNNHDKNDHANKEETIIASSSSRAGYHNHFSVCCTSPEQYLRIDKVNLLIIIIFVYLFEVI
jgi:anthranilate/para-aminobenzoate synthase component I